MRASFSAALAFKVDGYMLSWFGRVVDWSRSLAPSVQLQDQLEPFLFSFMVSFLKQSRCRTEPDYSTDVAIFSAVIAGNIGAIICPPVRTGATGR